MMEIFEKHKVGFVYLFECFDKNGKLKWREKIGNIIPDIGLDYLLEAALAGATRYSAWHIGISETAYAPLAGDDMATLLAAAPECKKYSGTTRKALTADSVASGLWSNAGTPAEFTFTSSASVKVGFISSSNVWVNPTGLLVSAVQFPSPRSVVTTDVLRVIAGIQLISA